VVASARILVVANRTAGSSELIATLRDRVADSAAHFTLLVPATPRGLSWAADMKAGEPTARRRAAEAARSMRMAGLEVEIVIGDPDPVAAVGDQLRMHSYDEIIVATLPAGISRWLRLSLPQRIRRMTKLPLTHVTATEPQLGLATAVAAPTRRVGASATGALER